MKSFLVSKRFWFNFLGGILIIASKFGFEATDISPQTVQVAGFVVMVINLYLSFKTQEPLGLILPGKRE